jgi:hypothetical protein
VGPRSLRAGLRTRAGRGDLGGPQRQSGLLSAAEALEKRAERIQEWLFDEGMFARVVAISSTVAAAIVARLLLSPFGL